VSDAENSYLLHVGKCLVQVNGHYCYPEDLINILSLVTQELSCNRSGCSAMLKIVPTNTVLAVRFLAFNLLEGIFWILGYKCRVPTRWPH